MDLAADLELEKKKQQMAEHAKTQVKLKRQLRIFIAEKNAYALKTNNDLSKMQRALDILEFEKDIELDRNLATKQDSESAKDARTVRNLVKSAMVVQDMYDEELNTTKQLNKKINLVSAEVFEARKEDRKRVVEHDKFRVPTQETMNNRIEHANARYHIQRHCNNELKERIDNAIIMRNIFIKEEKRLNKQLEALNKEIVLDMNEASMMYEERDRTESTRQKVQEHLSKVKENYMNELLMLSTGLTEDRLNESFMRIKQKDLGDYIREKRTQKKMKMKAMLQEKDVFSVIFDRLKESIGKNEMDAIVKDFIKMEQDNFSTFLTIGELMEDNMQLRADIRDIGTGNVDMETNDLAMVGSRKEAMTAVQDRITTMKKNVSECQKRIDGNGKILSEFFGHVKGLIGTLKLNPERMKSYKGQELHDKNILPVLTEIEETVGLLIQDFTMVELSTRATEFSKSTHSVDDAMMMRRPSIQIEPRTPSKVVPLSTSGKQTIHPSDLAAMQQQDAMSYGAMREYVVKTMVDRPSEKMDRRGKSVKIASVDAKRAEKRPTVDAPKPSP